MDLTGPTDAVDLVSAFNPLSGAYGFWHGFTEYTLDSAIRLCDQMRTGVGLRFTRASRADIRLGFVRDLCPECKAALEYGLDSRTREA